MRAAPAAARVPGGFTVQPSSEPWWKNPTTRLLAQWAFFIVIVFVCIEFQYNAVIAASMGADGIAQMNGMLASFAGIGQTFSNLLLTPFLLQMRGGVGYALLVTPLAAMCGELLLVSFQSVPTAFIVRSFDFIFRAHVFVCVHVHAYMQTCLWRTRMHARSLHVRSFDVILRASGGVDRLSTASPPLL